MNNNQAFIDKLRTSGLRPTKQRILIAKNLFERSKTFHFNLKSITLKLYSFI